MDVGVAPRWTVVHRYNGREGIDNRCHRHVWVSTLLQITV